MIIIRGEIDKKLFMIKEVDSLHVIPKLSFDLEFVAFRTLKPKTFTITNLYFDTSGRVKTQTWHNCFISLSFISSK